MAYILSDGELETLCDPISIIINKRFLKDVPIGFFVCYRQILGTILASLFRGV